MNIKWLYRSDFKPGMLDIMAAYWTECGYRVFIQGYSAMEVQEYGVWR